VLPRDELDTLVIELPSPEERIAVDTAITRCAFRTPYELVDPWRVLALLRLEDILDVPPDHRGLLPAVWCIEASMRTEAVGGGLIRGDYREGKGHLSHGPFQLSTSLRNACNGAPGLRHDLIAAARCWVANVYRVLPKAAATCPSSSWVHAEALVSNPRSYRGQCRLASKHYRLIGK